ncbi:MAG: sulfotransferase domain-containing protein [Rhizomicrobium sp.]
MNGNLVFIAGYPKSGSTWLRFVLESLRRGTGELSIADMTPGYYGGWRRLLFDEFSPVNAADLTAEEIDDTLPDVFRQLSGSGAGPFLVKAHDLLFRTQSGQWLFPPECVRVVFYLARHPFDVAVSYAHHLALPVGEVVAIMGRDSVVAKNSGTLRLPLHERIGSWSSNIESWLGETPYRVHAIRYEDVHADPVSIFSHAAAAAGLEHTAAKIASAAAAASFPRLQEQERQSGFSERPRTSTGFFRVGRPLSWRGELDDGARAKIAEDHASVMERMGYMDDGRVVSVPDPAQAPR